MVFRGDLWKWVVAINHYFWQRNKVYGWKFIVYTCEPSQNVIPARTEIINEKQIHIWNNWQY